MRLTRIGMAPCSLQEEGTEEKGKESERGKDAEQRESYGGYVGV